MLVMLVRIVIYTSDMYNDRIDTKEANEQENKKNA